MDQKSNLNIEMVSIIIPHFNRSVLILETLNSVKKQNFTDWEIIIVDDGSDEDQWEKLKTYESNNIKIFKRIDRLKGPSRCRNIGVSECIGEYLIFLDSDDLLADFCLEQRVVVMKSDPEADLGIFIMEEFFNNVGDTKRNYNRIVPFNELTGSFLQGRNPWNVTCPIWKKEFFDKVGGFDVNLLFMEDPDLHLRALNLPGAKIKICYDKPADCYYRISHMDDTKKHFWFNSVFYRIQFYKKLTEKNYGKYFIFSHKKDIKIGVYNLIRTFLYSRKNQLPGLYINLLEWMKESELFSSFEILRIRSLINFGNSSLWILRKFKIRGICFRMLPFR